MCIDAVDLETFTDLRAVCLLEMCVPLRTDPGSRDRPAISIGAKCSLSVTCALPLQVAICVGHPGRQMAATCGVAGSYVTRPRVHAAAAVSGYDFSRGSTWNIHCTTRKPGGARLTDAHCEVRETEIGTAASHESGVV